MYLLYMTMFQDSLHIVKGDQDDTVFQFDFVLIMTKQLSTTLLNDKCLLKLDEFNM